MVGSDWGPLAAFACGYLAYVLCDLMTALAYLSVALGYYLGCRFGK